MSEPSAHVLRCDRLEREAQGFDQLVERARFQFAQDRFDFRPTLFNRVQVRRIGR